MTTTTRKGRRGISTVITEDPAPTPAKVSQATFLHDDVTSLTLSRWARLAGWKRLVVKAVSPAVTGALVASYVQNPAGTAGGAKAVALALGYAGTRRAAGRIRQRRFRATYVRPLAQALAQPLGETPWKPDLWLQLSPDMPGLAARLVRPMSPAEHAVRRFYGTRVQPVLLWAPERAMRVYWWGHDRTGPARKVLDWFRTPVETAPARLQITIRAGFVSRGQRELIREAVIGKLGLSDLVESWDLVGRTATVTYTVREHPPAAVGLDDVRDVMARLPEHEFCVGLTTGRRPVIISLDDDAPHFACSAGSGAGKSVLAKALAMQVIAKGGHVTILDRKGSHRWARKLPGITYCTTAGHMHEALIGLSALADQRNEQALIEDEGWDPGRREFIIFEEMNATIPLLRMYWDDVRQKGDPKASPAINAFRNIMYMGRSAKMNLFGVAQMLTAQTTGGPEARENFGVRALARYTANNWKMLAPECPMPRKSKTRGRWQFVIAGEATEVQVVFIADRELWAYLEDVPESPSLHNPADLREQMETTPDEDNLITLQDAVSRFCPGISVAALKQRRTRARRTGGGPAARAQRGRTELYDADEFLRWLTDESLTETPHV